MKQRSGLAFAVVTLILCGCGHAPNGSSSAISPVSILDFSRGLKNAEVLRFMTSNSQILLAAIKDGGREASLLRYDSSGHMQGEPQTIFRSSGAEYAGVVTDIIAGSEGEIGMLTHFKEGDRVRVLSESGVPTKERLLDQPIQQVAITLRQAFVLTDKELIRADDGFVMAKLPDRNCSYYLLPAKNAKLLMASKTLPFIFIFDLARTSGTVRSLESPEMAAALVRSTSAKAAARQPAMVGAAVDADGTIYLALSPDKHSNLHVLKLDESGNLTGGVNLQLPSNSMAVEGIGYLGGRLLVYFPIAKKIAAYQLPDSVFVP